MELTKDELQLLLEVALMAVGQNHFVSAAAILDALEGYRPGHESLDVARAVMLLSQRHSREALDFITDQALERHPGNGLLEAFRGVALIQLGRNEEARPILQNLLASDDVNAAGIAQGMLAVI